MGKGISAVIATILILMITLALTGMAAAYIFGLFGTAVQGIEIKDFECVEGATDKARVVIRNIGDRNNTVNVKQTAPSADTTVTTSSFTIEPGQEYPYEDTCGGTGARFCVYRFTPTAGRSVSATVPCT